MKQSHEDTSPLMQLFLLCTIAGAFVLIGLGGWLLNGADISCKFCKIWWNEFFGEGENY